MLVTATHLFFIALFFNLVSSTRAVFFSQTIDEINKETNSKHSTDFRDHHDPIDRCGYEEPSSEAKKTMQTEQDEYFKSLGAEAMEAIKQSDITVNVYFHVITDSEGTGEVTDEQISKQMDVLNYAFQGTITGTSSSYAECTDNGIDFDYDLDRTVRSPFRFVLVDIIRIPNNDEAFNLDSNESKELQKSLRKGTCADLNVFTGTSVWLGYAFLPSFCSSGGNPNLADTLGLKYSALPEGGSSDFEEGDTLVHEIGHWLGLYHTFEGGCEGDGDEVLDTPPENEGTPGCPLTRDSCEGGGPDPVHNYMNYSNDCCMYHFTNGQVERMILQSGQHRGFIAENNNPTPAIDPISPPSPTFQISLSSAPSIMPSQRNFDINCRNSMTLIKSQIRKMFVNENDAHNDLI